MLLRKRLPHLFSILFATLLLLLITGLVRSPMAPLPGGREPVHRPRAMTAGRAPQSPRVENREEQQVRLGEAYGKLPLSFEANEGQTDAQVKFLARGSGYNLFLTATEAVITLRPAGTAPPSGAKSGDARAATRNAQASPGDGDPARLKSNVLRMSLVDANRQPRVTPLDQLRGKSNYFNGRDPRKWRTDVSRFARVRYEAIYPGIDLIYYGNQSQLEYDFHIAPGASPGRVRLAFEGARRIRVDEESGDLVLETTGGELRQHKPVVYQQEEDGDRREITGRYVVKNRRTVGFEVADYDTTKPLVIDPVLSYSTFLGGTSVDLGESIAVDSFGNAYVVGRTSSPNFPTTAGAFDTVINSTDAYVAKLNAAGTSLIYSTFLGGTGSDFGNDIAIDSFGNAYVTGTTTSTDFPLMNAFQSVREGSSDVFVTRLNPTGTALGYSTLLGGTGTDLTEDIAVDDDANAYVTGSTTSINFDTQNPFQPDQPGFDAFVSKFDTKASGAASLVYSTYLGGSGDDFGFDIAVDLAGRAHVTGRTMSANFPLTNPFANALGGGADAFVTKFDPNGAALVYSTYLGGSGEDSGNGIALDSDGNAYIAGNTSSTNFPVLNAFQNTMAGVADAFVTKLQTGGGALVYSTYLGGSGSDIGAAIAVDSLGNAYVAGFTNSTDFPTQSPFQSARAGGQDGFVARLVFGASVTLAYSTYLGGDEPSDSIGDSPEGSAIPVDTIGSNEPTGDNEQSRAIAVDTFGSAYVTGDTRAPDFPSTPGAFQTTAAGADDAFISKLTQFGSCNAPGYAPAAGSPFDVGQPPVSVGVGDFDNDGNNDIVSLNFAGVVANTLSFLPGDGTGSFGPRIDSTVGAAPAALAIGDFNEDGNLDVVLTDAFPSNNVTVMLGDGAGTFAPSAGSPFTAGDTPVAVVVGDYNEDGNLDVVTGNQTSNNVSVLLGDGFGGLGAPSNVSSGSPRALASADFDLDGHLDLAVANQSGSILVFVGNGGGGLITTASMTASGPPVSITVADFNLDGDPDLATADSTAKAVTVYIGGSGSNFPTTSTFSLPNDARSIASGDFNGDNRPDIGVANGNNVSILLGNGAGGFGAGPHNFATGGNTPVSLASGDFNNDTRPDFATGNSVSNNVSVLLSSCGLPNVASAIVVNSADDANDGTCNSAHCSLREAINAANASVGEKETITFNISGAGVHTITPATLLPDITDPVIIDGYTQPGASPNTLAVGNNAVLLIELNGVNLPIGGSGLRITGGGSTVRGLVINRCSLNGIRLVTVGGNQITGNFLGTNPAGTSALGNSDGITTTSNSDNNIIGGTANSSRNLISGNINGVFLGSDNNFVMGNYIGTNAAGNAALANTGAGVVVVGSSNNSIGGATAAERNVISGNGGDGVEISDSSATGNIVRGNFIGTNASGAAAIPNAAEGVSIGSGSGNIIGGSTVGAGNVISGNGGNGVLISSNNLLTGNTVQGNFIGTDMSGAVNLGNALDGVRLSGAQSSIIGGAGGAGNRIAFNGGDGVSLTNAFNNVISSNSIFSNTGLGIDLSNNGVTPNDAGDADSGPNNLQNFPILTSAQTSGGSTSIMGTLNSTPNANFRIEFFSDATCDPSGNGEGRTFLGFSDVATDASGNANINVTLSIATTLGEVVTATATDSANNTSEFSACRTLATPSFSISGHVADANGNALVGINISLSGSQTAVTTTDAAGNYSFINLVQNGNFTVTPSETNFRFTPASRDVNNLNGSATGIDFTGALINHTITGRVVDAQGAGIPDVVITLSGALSAVTRTDQNGNFAFPNVPANGNFTITPEKEGFTFNPPRAVFTDLSNNALFEAVGEPQAQPTPTPVPSDDFSSDLIDPERWSIGILSNPPASFDPLVQVFQRDGLLHIQPRSNANGPSYSGLVTARSIDLNATPIISVEAVRPAQGDGTQTIFAIGTDANNWFRFVVGNTSEPPLTPSASRAPDAATNDTTTGAQSLLFQLNLGGAKFSTGIGYNPAQHRFWRFRHNAPASLIIFETSPDAQNWTEQFHAQIGLGQTHLIAELSAGTFLPSSNPVEALFDNFIVTPTPRVQFVSFAESVSEDAGSISVQVIRTGNAESPFTVDFTTADGTAKAGSDYTHVSGTLTFDVGERSKTITVPIVKDEIDEQNETFDITLSNPVGGGLGSISKLTVTIREVGSANPIDDTAFFVRQHFLDFLAREPDEAGLRFWVNNIESCGADALCREVKRIDTSAAFFLSIEFQETGYVVQRFYKASFGRPPLFAGEFLPDQQLVKEGVIVGETGAPARLEQNKRAFAAQWVARPAFKQRFDSLNEMQYVDALAANAGFTLPEEERTALIVELLTGRETRAGVLLKIVEQEEFKRAEFNAAFVRMEYFGYLRRDPDAEGFAFWLAKLNEFDGDFRRADMVKAFITSAEYRARFGQP